MKARDNEKFSEAIAAERDHIERAQADAEDLEIDCEFTDDEVVAIIDRIEAAHRREVAELRECMKEAIEVACDGCHLAVWHNQKFVKCKKHSNWKCPFGTERWRKALEGANYEDK